MANSESTRDSKSKTGLFDMDAEDFEFYIKEMGYDRTDPKKARFLRDEWTKANTLGGKATAAYEEATAVPEGRTRMGTLPFTKPEGMTGIEAILSGQTELAFPGFMTGVGEAVTDTLSTGEKMTSGISTTQEELDQAGLTLGELAMVATVPTTAPYGSVRSGLGVTKKKSEINPLFKPKDTVNSDITFYSPLRSAIQEMQFSDKGKLGQEITAYLNKRAPNVSKGELDFSQLNLDPKKRYSKDEVLNSLAYSTEGVTARYIGLGEAKNARVQIQNVSDPKDGYFEFVLEAKDTPEPLFTHHTEKTLAHSRSTVHTDVAGEKYILVNELQSDALQNIGKRESTLEDIPDPFDLARATSNDLRDFVDVEIDESILEFGVGHFVEGTPFNELKKKYKDTFGLDVNGNDPTALSLDALRQTAIRGENFSQYTSEYEFEEAIEGLYFDLLQNQEIIATQRTEGIPSNVIPFKTNTEYVKNLLLANIGVAKKSGINKIVIPPLDEIARLRAKDFDGGFEGAKKALGPTYVNAVKKAVNILNSEYGDKIKIGSKELKYPDLTKESKERVVYGKELDITNFDFDPTKQKVRFAKGGLAMDDQMNKLFMARGGLKDDGMNMDPVSGNEIPPGSLAEEVRDDIPAQLSDGEYVVPADVVRYYGVKFFEDLREEAKVGLSDMETNGRIGGEPAPVMPPEMGQDVSPEMVAAAIQKATSQGQSPVKMQVGGFLAGNRSPTFIQRLREILGEESFNKLFPSFAQTTEGTTQGTTQGTSQASFKSDAPTFDPQNYLGGNLAIPGSSTISQISGQPYTYRYIDPITGKVLPVSPGETPPENAIPIPAENYLPPRDESDSDERREQGLQTVDPSTYDPTNINGVNFVDPMAGIDAALGTSFGERAVVAGAGMFGGPIVGAAAKGFTQVNSLATARANLEVVGEQFGFDSEEYKAAEEKINEAAGSTFADNLVPEALQNGSMILSGAKKKYGAYQQATRKTNIPRDNSDDDRARAEERAREIYESYDDGSNAVDPWSGTTSGVETVNIGGSEEDGSYGVSVSVGSSAPTTSPRPPTRAAEGGLMQRKSPVKKK